MSLFLRILIYRGLIDFSIFLNFPDRFSSILLFLYFKNFLFSLLRKKSSKETSHQSKRFLVFLQNLKDLPKTSVIHLILEKRLCPSKDLGLVGSIDTYFNIRVFGFTSVCLRNFFGCFSCLHIMLLRLCR